MPHGSKSDLQILAQVIECRANKNCTYKQKHVVTSGVGVVCVFGKKKHYSDPECITMLGRTKLIDALFEKLEYAFRAGILENDFEACIPAGITNVGTEQEGTS